MTEVLMEPVARTMTAEEYSQFESSRVELVDGLAMVSDAPTGRHQDTVKLLERLLETVCPGRLRIVREQEATLGELLRRIPDLMAVRASAYNPDSCRYQPTDIELVIEVVSPSSRTRDRLHKLAEYAEAGIPHYWWVETRPDLAVHTYRLGDDRRYLETGLFVPGDVIAAPGLPWAKIDLSALDLD